VPDELGAERSTTETVVVLFTDLVDSTQTALRLDRVAADNFRRRHFGVLRDAIAASGGWEVKNLGDGLMVAFTTCSAAVACAVAMQQGVERNSAATDVHVGLRVGLSVGEATREADDFFGEPVIEAARLCGAARDGQILAGRVVASMVGRRGGREFASVGPLTLKGLIEPFDAVEVRWEPLPRADTSGIVPLPDGLRRHVVRTFVGRGPELEAVMDEFKVVASGGGRRVVFVAGEPGIGKTTLAANVAMRADSANACVLFGHCDEQALSAYQPFVEALDHYVSHGPLEIVQNSVDSHGASLAGLAPSLRRRVALPPTLSADAETSRYLLFGSVNRLLFEASERQPLVVILDDLQWADDATLHLLRHLVESLEPARVFVLGIYRDAELTHGHPLSDVIAGLHRTGGFRRIHLHGLGDDDVANLLAASAGHDLDHDGIGLAHALREETEGNPFFVRELLRHLSETGGIYQDDAGRWRAAADLETVGLPQSIREVIGARVARLGPRCEQVLEAAAVIGREFDLAVLQALLGVDETSLLDMLDQAMSASLLLEVPGRAEQYRFSHVLIRHTLYDALSTSRRSRLHGRVAEVVESLPGPGMATRVSELARHWRASIRPVNVGKALRYARLAGDAAMASLAPQDACQYYQQALDLHAELEEPDPLGHIDVLIGLGTAQRLSGDGAFKATLMGAAE
jgi:class 3 adenylate cyclase